MFILKKRWFKSWSTLSMVSGSAPSSISQSVSSLSGSWSAEMWTMEGGEMSGRNDGKIRTFDKHYNDRERLNTICGWGLGISAVSKLILHRSVRVYLAVCSGLWPAPGRGFSVAAWPWGPAGTLSPSAAAPPTACPNSHILYFYIHIYMHSRIMCV